ARAAGAWRLSKDCSFRRCSGKAAASDRLGSHKTRTSPHNSPATRPRLARLANTHILISRSEQRRENATTRSPCPRVGVRRLVVYVLRAGGDLESSGVHRLLCAVHQPRARTPLAEPVDRGATAANIDSV